MKFNQLMSRVAGKPRNTSEALTGRATKWIADRFGVSESTARRWRRGATQPRDAGKRAAAMDSVDTPTRRKIAANALRGASAINVGKLGVEADSPPGYKATRNVGLVQLGAAGRAKMQEAGDLWEQGDEEGARRAQSDAILHSDGRDYGPLNADDYGPGFELI